MIIGNFMSIGDDKYIGGIHTLLFTHRHVTITRQYDNDMKPTSSFGIWSWLGDGTCTQIGHAFWYFQTIIVRLQGPFCGEISAVLEAADDFDRDMVLTWKPQVGGEESG